MTLPAPPGNGIMPSVLGRYWVDAQFILAGAGLITLTPPLALTLQASGPVQMLMADNTLITADDVQDLADANPPLLPAPYVISQFPPPNITVSPGASVEASPVQLGIGYPIPTSQGIIPVP